jgi:hypothetical protein
MTAEELQKEWENYTRQISAGATTTATSVLLMPLTGGISAVGLGLSAPRIHNARKKREIIEAGLKARGTTHHTRTGDVLAPMAVSGIISGLTLGLVPPGAGDLAAVATGRAVEIAATNTALNATEAVVVGNARKKLIKEGDQEQFSPEQTAKYGSMAVPFLMEESVLAFQQETYQQSFQPPCGNEASSTGVQPFQSSPGATSHQSMILQHQYAGISSSSSPLSIDSASDPQQLPTDNQAPARTSDADLFASIPSHQ